jgi:hypothetical protein
VTSKSNQLRLYKNNMLSEAQCGIMIFILLICRFFLYTQYGNYSSWVTTYYVLSYDLGFIPRAFIGSVIALFTDYLTTKGFEILATAVTLTMLAIVSALLGKAIGKSEPDLKPAVIIFTFLFLTAPLCLTNMLERHFGRLDTFLLIFTLVGLVCLKRTGFKWAVPVLCFAAVATHPGFIVTYMPALIIPLLYEVYSSKNSKKSIVLFSACCLIFVSFFIYFQFLSPQVNFAGAEDLAEHLSKRTDMKIATPMLYLEYFAPHKSTLSNPSSISCFLWPMIRSFALPAILVFTAISSPLIIIFGTVWKASFRKADNNFLKFIFVLCALAPLAFIPAAMFGQDWERWWAAAISCQFILIFYFVFSEEKVLTDSIKKVYDFFSVHTLMLLCIFAFSGAFMLSDINSFILVIFDKNVFYDFFEKVLTNYDHSLV